ncbi:ATP-binding cassette domain-containing protein [Pendulispora rubella]|uniref:ATP-binding cassette domain-containing protein n=1 Tax=Pendulispora rubella TaxID=2741070 RepID=A0ABZ2KT03_9BACT
MKARLEASALRVVRGGKVILRDVDIVAGEGEVLGILGPSGAGKSTLFRALVGESPPDAGTVRLGGEDVTHWPLWKRARQGIGYIPQSPSVLWDLTVRQNLITFHRVVHQSDGKPEERAAQVGLAERLDVRAGELSAGERRRLEFARAITREPHVLVCDEPFSGIDPVGAARLGELLRDLAGRGTAVLLADHHVEEALRVCSRAILLLDGAVAVTAVPGEFEKHPLVRGRYLGTLHPLS